MKSVSSLLLSAAVTGTAMAITPPTIAQETSAFSGNAALTTDYRFRGISQNNARPAIQGGFDWENGPLSFGTWASNVSWLSDIGGISNSMEWDFYGGYTAKLGGQDIDLGLIYYYYPGKFPAGLTSPNTAEFSIGTSVNALALSYSISMTNLFGFDDSKGSGYLDVSYDMPVKGFDIGFHLGYQDIRNNDDCPYADWSISGSKSVHGFDVSLAYIDTNAKDACWVNGYNRNLGKGTLVLSIGKTL
ncbi:MAG: TorF family putative porin [Burkholderiaceae bacterium]